MYFYQSCDRVACQPLKIFDYDKKTIYASRFFSISEILEIEREIEREREREIEIRSVPAKSGMIT